MRSAVFDAFVGDRKIRIGAGACQCSHGYRESYPRSREPAAEPVTERIRACHGEYYEQVSELHCEFHHFRFRLSSVLTQRVHWRVLLSNTNPTSFATMNRSLPKNPNPPNRTLRIPPPRQCRCSTYLITSARLYVQWPGGQNPTLQDQRALKRRTLTLIAILPRIPKTPNLTKPC